MHSAEKASSLPWETTEYRDSRNNLQVISFLILSSAFVQLKIQQQFPMITAQIDYPNHFGEILDILHSKGKYVKLLQGRKTSALV